MSMTHIPTNRSLLPRPPHWTLYISYFWTVGRLQYPSFDQNTAGPLYLLSLMYRRLPEHFVVPLGPTPTLSNENNDGRGRRLMIYLWNSYTYKNLYLKMKWISFEWDLHFGPDNLHCGIMLKDVRAFLEYGLL